MGQEKDLELRPPSLIVAHPRPTNVQADPINACFKPHPGNTVKFIFQAGGLRRAPGKPELCAA
jgi:hypothetical protein